MKYYLSDTHFDHENIIKLSQRPFKSIEAMNKKLIENWNEVVRPNDEVYFLGDLCYKGKPLDFLRQLKGKKFLIVGNHDTKIIKNDECRKYFEDIQQIMTIEDLGKSIVMCHYPMAEWAGMFRGSIHLYGHIHNNLTAGGTYNIMKNRDNAYNVGADILDFKPRTLPEVIECNRIFNDIFGKD
jgi:calcineurin-like phosphoesterase family protein